MISVRDCFPHIVCVYFTPFPEGFVSFPWEREIEFERKGERKQRTFFFVTIVWFCAKEVWKIESSFFILGKHQKRSFPLIFPLFRLPLYLYDKNALWSLHFLLVLLLLILLFHSRAYAREKRERERKAISPFLSFLLEPLFAPPSSRSFAIAATETIYHRNCPGLIPAMRRKSQ